MRVEDFHELGKIVMLKDINELESFFKQQGKLKHNIFKANSRRLVITNYDEYEFQITGEKKYQDTDTYIVVKYPGFVTDKNYKESFMANIIGIPSAKHSRKYYDRRRY